MSSKDQTESLVSRVGPKIFVQQNLNNSGLRSRIILALKKFVWPDAYVFHNLSIAFVYWFKYYKASDVLITISQPYSTHLIGLLLKFRHPKMTWIVDIGDNYSENPTNTLYLFFKPLMVYFEKRVLKKADFIVFNSEVLKTYYLSKYPLNVNKIHIIPNGSAIDFIHFSSAHPDQLIISYIGNTYEPVRTGVKEIELLIHALSLSGMNMSKVEIWLVGKQCISLLESVKRLDWVKIKYCDSESDLLTVYQKTSILINFANINYPGLPSKLDEYKQSGLPIINFNLGSNDPSVNYLGTVDHILHYNYDLDGFFELSSFIEKYKFFRAPQSVIGDSIDTMWVDLIKKTN